MTRLAIFPGSFDPLTNGHRDIIERSLGLFDTVVIAVSINISKQPLFSVAERMAMVQACFVDHPRLVVESLEGLLAAYAAQRGANAIIRGLRAPSDFEYELRMAQMNRHLNPKLETVFLATEADGAYVSSSLVKEVTNLGGDVSKLVPPHVHTAMIKRFAERAAQGQ